MMLLLSVSLLRPLSPMLPPFSHSKVKHIRDRDFAVLIDQALEMEGFREDHPLVKNPPTTTMTGFGHDAVLSVAGEVVQAVKEGRIKRFFLIGGCDGFEGERSYYRDLALGLPKVSG